MIKDTKISIISNPKTSSLQVYILNSKQQSQEIFCSEVNKKKKKKV